MSYAALFESCAEPREISFSELNENISSLIEFAMEDVMVNVSMTFNEATDEGASKKKVSESVKNFMSKIVEKIKEFFKRFSANVKNFIAKAKVAVAKKGNDAMAKLLADSKKVLKKSITVTDINGDYMALFRAETDFLAKVVGEIQDLGAAMDRGEFDFAAQNSYDREQVEKMVDTLKEELSSSDVAKTVDIKSGTSVKAAYEEHVKAFVDDGYKIAMACSGLIGEVKKAENAAIKGLKATNKTEWATDETRKAVSVFNMHITDMIRIDTVVLNFGFKILSIGVKNSAKIALAAGAEKKEEKKEEKK